jgi:hypothetical protein
MHSYMFCILGVGQVISHVLVLPQPSTTKNSSGARVGRLRVVGLRQASHLNSFFTHFRKTTIAEISLFDTSTLSDSEILTILSNRNHG